MRATGMVRRIDELGRVVIPKSVRELLNIKDSDPLEIFYEHDKVILMKYAPNDPKTNAVEVLQSWLEDDVSKGALTTIERTTLQMLLNKIHRTDD